jgi:dihydroorotase-like cyclic amidohydrolase
LCRLLIKGGEIVNESGREKADVYVEDQIIRQLLCMLCMSSGTQPFPLAIGIVVISGSKPSL